ncbi:tRNA-2-methylthio-N(6)-dimethylallyladenosine synthase [subsurface metagenome]
MKIILLNPPRLFSDESPVPVQMHHPPLGLLDIAAVLEEARHEVSICDAAINHMDFEQVRQELRQGYDIIGITALTITRDSTYICASIAKEENKESTVVLGGPHVTFLPELILGKLPFVDIVVRGEGELTFLELVQRISVGESYQDINGISFRNEKGLPCSNEERKVVENLDSLPFPAWHLVPMRKYFTEYSTKELSLQKPCAVIMTSRGCPGDCIFCSCRAMWGRRVRRKTPEKVIEEIERLHYEYGVKDIHFLDDTFTFNKRWVTRFCDELMKSKTGITWRCQGRVDTVDDTILATMKKAGCYYICYGVESGAERMQGIIQKGITVAQAAEAIKLTKGAGIFVSADFIVGLPGETREDMEQTFAFIKKSPLHAFSVNAPWIFPGTALYRQALAEGKVDETAWFKPCQPIKSVEVPLFYPFYVSDSFSDEAELISLLNQKNSELRTLGFLVRRMVVERHRWFSLSHLVRHAPSTLFKIIKIILRKIKWGFARKPAT